MSTPFDFNSLRAISGSIDRSFSTRSDRSKYRDLIRHQEFFVEL